MPHKTQMPDDRATAAKTSGVTRRSDADPLRVVWAEDNDDTREMVAQLLRHRFEVVAVADGETALAAVLTSAPDVVLADVVMPGLGGVELLKALRADPRTADTPVILLSGRATEDTKIEGLNEGADDYIAKPFNLRELLARVASHAKMSRYRRDTNAALRGSEERLRRLNAELDQRVRDRTAELLKSERQAVSMAELAERRAEQLQTLTAELIRAEQRERQRIAAILHDHIQQLLVAARMRLEIVRIDGVTDDQQEQLHRSEEILGEAVDACRSLAVDLSPPALVAQGLVAAIRWLAESYHQRHALTVEVAAADDVVEPQAKEVRELLFLATKELLLNVIKHAGTDRAWVSIVLESPRTIRIEVRDEGKGFAHSSNRADPADMSSWGLFNTRERIDSIGGKLVIESSPGRGTRVVIRAPC